MRLIIVPVLVAALALAGCSSSGSGSPAAGRSGAAAVQTTDPAADNYSYPPPASFGPGSNVAVETGAPASSAPPAPEQVTYSCTGHAPDGVDITYGPSGSQHSASRLPFTHTDKLDSSAQYYVTSAQLQGGGSVSCTTSVQVDNFDGSADVTSNSGSADGGYNIASAQVCGTFDGSWEKC